MEEIKIGKKNKSEYVSAVLFAFHDGNNSVLVAALGRQNSKALEVAESVQKFLNNVSVTNSETFKVNEKTGIRITLEKEGLG